MRQIDNLRSDITFLSTGNVNRTLVEANMTAVTNQITSFRKLQDNLLTHGWSKKRATEMLLVINALTNCMSTYNDGTTTISQNVVYCITKASCTGACNSKDVWVAESADCPSGSTLWDGSSTDTTVYTCMCIAFLSRFPRAVLGLFIFFQSERQISNHLYCERDHLRQFGQDSAWLSQIPLRFSQCVCH